MAVGTKMAAHGRGCKASRWRTALKDRSSHRSGRCMDKSAVEAPDVRRTFRSETTTSDGQTTIHDPVGRRRHTCAHLRHLRHLRHLAIHDAVGRRRRTCPRLVLAIISQTRMPRWCSAPNTTVDEFMARTTRHMVRHQHRRVSHGSHNGTCNHQRHLPPRASPRGHGNTCRQRELTVPEVADVAPVAVNNDLTASRRHVNRRRADSTAVGVRQVQPQVPRTSVSTTRNTGRGKKIKMKRESGESWRGKTERGRR